MNQGEEKGTRNSNLNKSVGKEMWVWEILKIVNN
jgi:hypothetical protein